MVAGSRQRPITVSAPTSRLGELRRAAVGAGLRRRAMRLAYQRSQIATTKPGYVRDLAQIETVGGT